MDKSYFFQLKLIKGDSSIIMTIIFIKFSEFIEKIFIMHICIGEIESPCTAEWCRFCALIPGVLVEI